MASVNMIAVLILGLISTVFFSVFLRGAIWLFNRTFAKSAADSHATQATQPIEPEFQVAEAGPYTAPATYSDAIDRRTTSIVPEPSLLKGTGIGALAMIVQAFTSAGLARLAGLISVAMMLTAVVGFCQQAVILKYTLPTTFLRGFAVTAILWFCVLVLALVVVVPFRLLWAV